MNVLKFPSEKRPELRTKSVFLEPSEDDGIRLMIVQRSLVDLCVQKDPELSWDPEDADDWIKALYPSEDQKRRILETGSGYRELKENYRGSLSHPIRRIFLEEIIKTVLEEQVNVTLLCVESGPSQCHRGITAEFAKEIGSQIPVIIR
jgi:uncharacterized protein YeaO (DUF488 family)